MRDVRKSSGNLRSCGFSLIEVVVVICVLSVLSFITFRGPPSSNVVLVAEMRLLRSQIRYAQSLALANNTDSWGVLISSGGYSLQKNGVTAVQPMPGQPSATYAFPSEVYVTQGSGVVLFDEWGSPGNAAVHITLSDGVYTRTITLSAETGHQS